ncbi:multisubunit sodium/proton antiporter MrpE subunit [Thioalkalivibrio sp. ALE21]|uniref:Na+/H+ antiporter subunit E n=1 Tax=Thioalkalivibrio sp. ALE21 TaxID=1158175 RepID=UPI000D99B9CE|nr:Na+/H+ antiporter subunit E [Thioalkalivibrio sp. ALE21]PYG01293.1 multisubunit sodium/proton antiporter MrpE subunit [Thioalkalivibrio sp. ALE21]
MNDTRQSSSNPPVRRARRPGWLRALLAMLAAAALWAVLAGGTALAHPFAWLAIALTGGAVLALPAGRALRLTPAALPGLLGFFLRTSVQGGVDVAWRAVHPRLPLQPGFEAYFVQLPHGPPLTLFMAMLSLLPGTLAVRLEGRRMTLHVLDGRSDNAATLSELERRIARLYGLDLDARETRR